MSLPEEQLLEETYVMPTFARKPVELVEGKGMTVKDSAGMSYLDFIAGIGVNSLGHCHPNVVKAISDQAARLIHVGNYYYIENRGEVARTLSVLLNEGESSNSRNWQTFFANSGAEANECAFKLARLWGKSQGNDAGVIITLEKSFHGRTLSTLAATGQPAKQEVFQPLPSGFIHIPINDLDALEAVFAQQGEAICAVMIECIQGESGVNPCTPEYLQAVASAVRAGKALLICDEIQTGIYRCGTYPFAFQHYGIVPDIVTVAKGVASGFPTGMCCAVSEIASAFSPGDHGTTFGGSALAVAASKATLETLADLDIARKVTEVGEYLRTCLVGLPHVTDVRGRGLMCGCDLEGLSASEVVDQGLKAGFLINSTGPSTLRFLPPLICEKSDVDELIAWLKSVLV